MKIVINKNFGGFGLSAEALHLLGQPQTGQWFGLYEIEQQLRKDPALVSVVETLGDKASAEYAHLEIVEIPDGVDWYITDMDGNETIREGRSWR